MKKILLAVLLSVVLSGCMSDTGLVYMDTMPDGATLYLNGRAEGRTPLTFEFTHDHPIVMTIEKSGYDSVREVMDAYWLLGEYKRGHYAEQHGLIIRGKARNRGWKVETSRKLQLKR